MHNMTTAQVQHSDKRLALIFWSTTAMILGFLILVHLGVLLCFLTTRAFAWVVPLALIAAMFLGDLLARRQGLKGKDRLWPIGLMLVMITLAVGISIISYDLSWDGQWYHQTGIYSMVQGWNPLREPMRMFPAHNELWVRHYAKGPWYVAAAMASLTGRIEAAKFATWLTIGAAFMAVGAAAIDAGMRRSRALALAGVVALNPVVISESVSFLVDGLMVCYLVCYVAVLLNTLRHPNLLVIFVGVAATICSINSKFTGLIVLCFVCAGAGLYCLVRRRDLFWRFTGLNLAIVAIGIGIFGYNPYVTNTICRKQPFYPLLGSKDFPSLAEQGEDPIERYETPPNMAGRHRLIRLGYSIFGRPSFTPYNNQPEAHLMWPFTARIRDLDAYRFHDTRIGGFGPFFSGALVLSLFLTGWLLFTASAPRFFLLLGYGILATSLLISVHMWWARYSPQTWWLPILPVAAAFWSARSRVQIGFAWVLIAIMVANVMPVAAVRWHWEVKSTQTLRRQLTALRDSGQEIEVAMGYFEGSMAERLKTWGIPFQSVGRIRNGQELMSVAQGNPGTVYYRFRRTSQSSSNVDQD